MQAIGAIANLSATEYKMLYAHAYTAVTRLNSSFGFILDGEVQLSYANKTITAKKHEIIFIPDYVVYKSTWTGKPNINFLSISFEMPKFANLFGIQKIKGDENQLKLFYDTINMLKENTIKSTLMAYSLFYKFFSDVISFLVASKPKTSDFTIQTAISFMSNNLDKHISVNDIARHCAVSQSTLYQTFNKNLGFSPVTVLNSLKIEKVCELLVKTNLPLKDIILKTYFSSENYLQKLFKKNMGMTTSAYRKTHKY